MKIITPKIKDTLIHNFLGGIAWGLGITVGVSLIAYLLSLFISTFGGLPLVGSWLADIVSATLEALKTK